MKIFFQEMCMRSVYLMSVYAEFMFVNIALYTRFERIHIWADFLYINNIFKLNMSER